MAGTTAKQRQVVLVLVSRYNGFANDVYQVAQVVRLPKTHNVESGHLLPTTGGTKSS